MAEHGLTVVSGPEGDEGPNGVHLSGHCASDSASDSAPCRWPWPSSDRRLSRTLRHLNVAPCRDVRRTDASFRQEARDAAGLAACFAVQSRHGCEAAVALAVSGRVTMTSAAGQGQLLAGRYRLQELVGAGGAGRVWRAMDHVLERMVAVKLLRPEVVDDPLAAAAFLAEARSASRLSHPGIAQVHDYGRAGSADVPFLVMELVDGPSLSEVLAAGPLDPDRTMDVVAQVAAGLQAAHSAGVVHRDIKPANLLTSRHGQMKITDFGIASVIGSAPVTSAGTVIGTPAYLAPERAAGASATPASDVYSLGVVAFECLTGTRPFSGPASEVSSAHLQLPFPPLPVSVPADIARLVAEHCQ